MKNNIFKIFKINYFIKSQDRFEKRKKTVQEASFDKLGVKVDLCLQGHGTTNTENLARRCFSEPEVFA